MHELALTESVVDAVCERIPDGQVIRVCLEVGRLTAVVPDAMRFCFEACTQGTRLEGAALDIVEVPAQVRCRSCGRFSELDSPIPLCACGSADLDIRSGHELRIREVEVS